MTYLGPLHDQRTSERDDEAVKALGGRGEAPRESERRCGRCRRGGGGGGEARREACEGTTSFWTKRV